MAKILVVDDETAILTVLERFLRLEGHAPLLAATPAEALAHFAQGDIELLLVDLRLNADMNGFDVMNACRRQDPALPVIVISAYGTVDTAVKAIREGAVDFVCKPFFLNDLRSRIEQGLCARSESRGAIRNQADCHFGTLIGESPAMRSVYALIKKAGACDLPVLIEGESGTGKELVAGAIHRSGSRAKKAWTAMNCAAISPLLLESEMFGHAAGAFTGACEPHDGMFIATNEGTLFLDEIGTLQHQLQAKLLRALEEGRVRRLGENETVPVDVRVLAATNRPLREAVAAGSFREDLYFRLAVIDIKLPPLRERAGDIPLLAAAFCIKEEQKHGKPVRLDSEAAKLIEVYDWPGNVRELENAIACAAVLADRSGLISPDELPPAVANRSRTILEQSRFSQHLDAGHSLDEYLRTVEKEYVDQIIRKTDGNRSAAAGLLGISRATFYRKYGDPDETAER